MIRNSIYCKYKGEEYQFKHRKDSYRIATGDKTKIDNSFQLIEDKFYKEVSKSDLEEVYSINSYAVYNGDIFYIRQNCGDSVVIGTNKESLAFDNKMTRCDKYLFEKTVPLSEVEVFEEKKNINI